MEIVHGRIDEPSASPGTNFTGQVYNDRLLEISALLRVGNVFFPPSARTYWHSHDQGQILQVASGQGRVASEGGPVQVIRPGDIIWTPPGELHWHGADAESYLVHMAITLAETQWKREVTAEEYGA